MDWSRAKTLLILCFLILDVFLLTQLLEKRQVDEYDYLNESTIEERLAAEEISYPELPQETITENYIHGTGRSFTAEELNALDNQNVLLDGNTVVSSLVEPYPLNPDSFQESAEMFMNRYVLDGDHYRYWSYDEEAQSVLLFQTFKEKTIYYNDNSLVILQLNEENQVVSYQQTMLEDIDQMDIDENKQQTILPAVEALKILFERNELYSGNEVTRVELGYYTLVPLANGVQVFSPTWHVIVDDERNYFINAIEGQIQQMNDGLGDTERDDSTSETIGTGDVSPGINP
ncbi:hypothetical protein G4V62_09765 [Bacillaceae bacterium SIJ1]|uniref:two-component system regulatory protein YycI n=1 Tax=Litoribacterium kuwaitense TaxID=1398745 RepID=UPI0013EAEE6B|nr:two-component system regulatory protein YycI [Litoribacterium kuwaitense]NGP45224.1 hypothetical protein [Litoribacterium kuwaitense]